MLKERYDLRERLGRQKNGNVNLAIDHVLGGREVVVKAMPAVSDRSEAFEPFFREARRLVPVVHPNLVSVNDYFVESGMAYFVMGFAEGQDLATLASEREVSMLEAAGWIEQITLALEHLHRQNPPRVFRGLEPEHVVIDDAGHVRLVNFGIAQFLDSGGWMNRPAQGSGDFASPEQRGGSHSLDVRSDVYSLGALMHALFTGQRPPAAMDRFNRGGQPVTPRELYAAIPADLEAIIVRAMAVETGMRFQRAQDVREALRRVPDASLRAPVGLMPASGSGRRAANGAAGAQPEVGPRGGPERPAAIPSQVSFRSRAVFVEPVVDEELEKARALEADNGPRMIVGTAVCGVALVGGLMLAKPFLTTRSETPAPPPPPPVAVASATTAPQTQAVREKSGPDIKDFTGIYLEFSPPDARVFVDGKLQSGFSPMTIALQPGEHNVKVEKAGYVTADRTVHRIEKGKTKPFKIAIYPEGTVPPQENTPSEADPPTRRRQGASTATTERRGAQSPTPAEVPTLSPDPPEDGARRSPKFPQKRSAPDVDAHHSPLPTPVSTKKADLPQEYIPPTNSPAPTPTKTRNPLDVNEGGPVKGRE